MLIHNFTHLIIYLLLYIIVFYDMRGRTLFCSFYLALVGVAQYPMQWDYT